MLATVSFMFEELTELENIRKALWKLVDDPQTVAKDRLEALKVLKDIAPRLVSGFDSQRYLEAKRKLDQGPVGTERAGE